MSAEIYCRNKAVITDRHESNALYIWRKYEEFDCDKCILVARYFLLFDFAEHLNGKKCLNSTKKWMEMRLVYNIKKEWIRGTALQIIIEMGKIY